MTTTTPLRSVPTLAAGQRHVEGCGGHLEVHGAGAVATGLCVVCAKITTHRHECGLPACEGAEIPQAVIDAAAKSDAMAWHLALLKQVGR
jgi:hypothetical protein